MEEFIIFFNSFVATFDANTISSWWMLCWCWCSCCCCCCYSYDYYFLFFSCSWPSRQLFFVFIVAFVCLAHNVSINSGWQRAISVLLTAIVLCFVSTRATSHSQTTSIYFFERKLLRLKGRAIYAWMTAINFEWMKGCTNKINREELRWRE